MPLVSTAVAFTYTHSCICGARKEIVAYLSNGLLICNIVCRLAVLVAGLQGITYECWAQGFNHEIVVVESSKHVGFGRAADGGGDVCGRHCDIEFVVGVRIVGGFGCGGWVLCVGV